MPCGLLVAISGILAGGILGFRDVGLVCCFCTFFALLQVMFWDRVCFLQDRIHRHTSCCNLTRAHIWTDIGLSKGPCSLLILPTWRLHLFLLNSILADEHELRPGESQAGEGRKKKADCIPLHHMFLQSLLRHNDP